MMLRRLLAAAIAVGVSLSLAAPVRAAPGADERYLVGRGISDITGEVAEAGLMGYGRFDQQAAGLHTRQRARSFVIADRSGGKPVLLIVTDLPMVFESVHQAVLRRLKERYGDRYNASNVMLTATHTHAGPGGQSHHLLYNLTSLGFHKKTFGAVTDGIVESVDRAHADIAPSSLELSHGKLVNASVNRSKKAFDRNPDADKAFFPDAIDPQSTVLAIKRDGRPVGVINWFATHNTSMSGENRLISADNKGYAALHWEREVKGVDYKKPDFVSAFAQTNAGDMSPNLDLDPPNHGDLDHPDNEFRNTRTIGLRQYDAAARQTSGTPVTGGVDARMTYADLSKVTVAPKFTGDGKEHRTCDPAIGAGMAAGSVEDGPAFPIFKEGENKLWDFVSNSIVYQASPELKQCQAPKGIVAPVGVMNKVYPWVQEQYPVQLVKVGPLYLIGIPGEVTITAGLRLRQTVAKAVGADVENVLVSGYTNSYMHYLTTPEEYDAQHYEGGSTLFGRWQLPALQQISEGLATAMKNGQSVPPGQVAPDESGKVLSLQPGVVLDAPQPGRKFGDVLTQPEPAYQPGKRVTAVFSGAHPSNNLHRSGSYVEVQRQEGTAWRTVADDSDWSTQFNWARHGIAASKVTVTWDIPPRTAGTYRLVYRGDAKSLVGQIKGFTGTSDTFTVA